MLVSSRKCSPFRWHEKQFPAHYLTGCSVRLCRNGCWCYNLGKQPLRYNNVKSAASWFSSRNHRPPSQPQSTQFGGTNPHSSALWVGMWAGRRGQVENSVIPTTVILVQEMNPWWILSPSEPLRFSLGGITSQPFAKIKWGFSPGLLLELLALSSRLHGLQTI